MSPLPYQDLEHVLEQTNAFWGHARGGRLFITGGTGFVGSWLVESFLHVIDRLRIDASMVLLTRDPEDFTRRAPHLVKNDALKVIGGDITSFEFPPGKFDFVIHAATQHNVLVSPTSPLGTFDSDILGTRRVLEFTRQAGARRLLFTSSGAVYGQQPPSISHINEEFWGAPSTTDASSAYGQAKRVSEFMVQMYGRVYGFDSLIARLFAFVGPRLPLDLNFAVGNFIRDALRGDAIRIEGDGTPLRSYLYAADLSVWLWRILFDGVAARPYNVGSDQSISIADLARSVASQIRVDSLVRVARQPDAGSLPRRYVPSIDRASSELDLKVLIDLDEGIRRTAAWHLPNFLGGSAV
jgi:dTDP-glucose 4,6-dehydratase